MNVKPYKSDENNNVELFAVISGVTTILSNLIYEEDKEVIIINNFVLIVTILINIIFVMKWIHSLCR